MASRNFSKPQTLMRGLVQLVFEVTGASAANPTGQVGLGGEITYGSATGKYVLTLDDKFKRCIFAVGSVDDATTQDDWSVVTKKAVSAGNVVTVELYCFKGGAAADLTTDEKLQVFVVVQNSSVGPSAD